jgi:hypothetical protein
MELPGLARDDEIIICIWWGLFGREAQGDNQRPKDRFASRE